MNSPKLRAFVFKSLQPIKDTREHYVCLIVAYCPEQAKSIFNKSEWPPKGLSPEKCRVLEPSEDTEITTGIFGDNRPNMADFDNPHPESELTWRRWLENDAVFNSAQLVEKVEQDILPHVDEPHTIGELLNSWCAYPCYDKARLVADLYSWDPGDGDLYFVGDEDTTVPDVISSITPRQFVRDINYIANHGVGGPLYAGKVSQIAERLATNAHALREAPDSEWFLSAVILDAIHMAKRAGLDIHNIVQNAQERRERVLLAIPEPVPADIVDARQVLPAAPEAVPASQIAGEDIPVGVLGKSGASFPPSAEVKEAS